MPQPDPGGGTTQPKVAALSLTGGGAPQPKAAAALPNPRWRCSPTVPVTPTPTPGCGGHRDPGGGGALLQICGGPQLDFDGGGLQSEAAVRSLSLSRDSESGLAKFRLYTCAGYCATATVEANATCPLCKLAMATEVDFVLPSAAPPAAEGASSDESGGYVKAW